MDKMNDGLVVCDSGLNVTRSNQKGRELLGLGELSAGWIERLGGVFARGYKGDLEHDLPLRDLDFDLERARTEHSGLLVVSCGTTVIRDTEGRTDSVVMILRDVTEQRMGQFLKGDFINLMSRKLRTPLAVSMEHLSLMQKAAVPMVNSPFKKSVDITVGKVSEYLKMTEKIFDFLAADVSAGFAKKPPAPGSIGVDRVQELVKAAVRDFPGKRVDCKFDFSGILELPIAEGPFAIVVRNLVENAIKFSKQPTTKLDISAVRDAHSVSFVVADNGPGIPAAEKNRVFDALRAAEDGGDAAPRGLALVHRIVAANQGDIRIDDHTAQGTSVRVTFPLAQSLVPA
jgi:signal transduction histidine kinase